MTHAHHHQQIHHATGAGAKIRKQTAEDASPPEYVNHETGEKFSDGAAMVNAYLAKMQDGARLDSEGNATVTIADIPVTLSSSDGVIVILTPIMSTPSARREEFFEQLLKLSLGHTADASFAVTDDGTVYARAFRSLDGLDLGELKELVGVVAYCGTTLAPQLREKFG